MVALINVEIHSWVCKLPLLSPDETKAARDEAAKGGERHPFLNFKEPEGKGDNVQATAYKVKFLEEPRDLTIEDRLRHFANVELLEASEGPDDKDYEPGVYTLDLGRKNLQDKLFAAKPLTGKVFTLAHLGKKKLQGGKSFILFHVKQEA